MLVLSAVLACQSLPSTGNPLAPVQPGKRPVASQAPVAEDGVTPAPAGSFDFDADAEEPAAAELPDDPIALLALQQGVEIPAGEPYQGRNNGNPDAPPQGYYEEPRAQLAIPADFLPDNSVDWGLRLVSTVHNVQPPRAIIGLPDGTEAIVMAGTILAEQQAVVMAVGHQTIEVAYITPAGYQAKVETRRINALFPE